MGERRVIRRFGWIAILVVVTSAASLAAAAGFLAPPPPGLRAAQGITRLPVDEDRFDDARSVRLSVKAPVAIELTAPASGRITAFPCELGMSIESGTSPVSLDGSPKLALATRVPLWRDLTLDSTGDDVRALQEELSRLGFLLRSDGVMGRNTLTAAAALFTRIGVTIDQDRVPLEATVWIPASPASVVDCEVPVGATVQHGARLATFARTTPTVSIERLPSDLIPGSRVVLVGESRFDVTSEGRVLVSDLSSFDAASATGDPAVEPEPIDGQLVLSDPVEVSVVVPSAIYHIEGATGCVSSHGTPYRVDLLGSRLGQTIVVFPRSRPTHVDTPPSTRTPCV